MLEVRDRNRAVDAYHTPLLSIEELMELVAAWKYWSTTDLVDGYYNIRIKKDSEQHSTFFLYMGNYRSLIMQQVDCNAPATRVRAIYEIFKEMVFQDLGIYIDDIIFSDIYDKHVVTLQKVLPWLLDEKFWLKASKCQFFFKCLDILGHILNPDGLHLDTKKCKQVLDFRVPINLQELWGLLGIVIFLRMFYPELASYLSTLLEL